MPVTKIEGVVKKECIRCKYWQRKQANRGDCTKLSDTEYDESISPVGYAWWGDYGGFMSSPDFYCAFWELGEHSYCQYCGEEVPVSHHICGHCLMLKVEVEKDYNLILRIINDLKGDKHESNS